MTGESQTREVCCRDMGKKGIATLVFEPEFEKSTAFAQDEAADGCVELRCCVIRMLEAVDNHVKAACKHTSVAARIDLAK